MIASSLPVLTAEESAHSAALLARICAEIDSHRGWLSFERYMEMALYEPGLGYYSAGARKLGAAGDFVTAPEISPLFSRCLARQCVQVLRELNGGDILELGAGSGVMATDILLELQTLDCLPEHYYILEVSADLRERQRTTLQERAPELATKVAWLDALPEELNGIVLANEVLDALPVQRFCKRGDQINAVGVTWQLNELSLSEVRANATLTAAVHAIENATRHVLPDGYCSEVNLRLHPWIKAIADSLNRGVILMIDYGLSRAQYYSAERMQGTMLCHFRHRFHDDALVNLGLQDIGSWVDFTAVAEAAVDCSCSVIGYTTQAQFLMGCGIDSLLAELADKGLESRLQVGKQAMVLVLPGEMGERFKAIALGKNWESPLIGFSTRDMAAAL